MKGQDISLQSQTLLHSRCNGTRPRTCQRREREPDWQKGLPAEWPKWRLAAVTPLNFSTFREYEMPASRTPGYDEDGQPCYYHHCYVLGELLSDDDEAFYEHIAYGEEVEAWRLRDERWLIWRIVHENGGCRGNRGLYCFSESMSH